MNKFLEWHHAFISATFYKLMKELDYPNYKKVFLLATQRYAEQRGNRMAQRAIRDGIELDFAAYRYYGEWKFTEDYLNSIDVSKQIECISKDPDYEYYVHQCAWADVYSEMGLSEDGGHEYCSDLDTSIARGFNPFLEFKVLRSIHCGGYCHHITKDAHFEKDADLGPRKPENMRNFDYHCAHLYRTFSDYTISVYKSDGTILSAKVLDAFSQKFGKEMADVLVSYRNTDFNLIF